MCLIATSASADPSAADLQTQGEDLAKQGRFSEAIESFKAADKLQASATHACLIALAYTRREAWPQAEVWLALCQVRATTADPLPDWAPAAQDQINQRLEAAQVAAVTIEVQPADAGAKITASSFAPDEQFTPRTIHLPFGMHTIAAAAPGYLDARLTVEVKDKTAQHVVIKLHKPDEGKAMPVVEKPNGGRKLMITGGILVGGGFVSWAVLGYGWNTLRNANATDYRNSAFSSNGVYYGLVGTTVALWAVGTGLFVYGYMQHKKHDETPAVGIAPIRGGGGMVSLEWTR